LRITNPTNFSVKPDDVELIVVGVGPLMNGYGGNGRIGRAGNSRNPARTHRASRSAKPHFKGEYILPLDVYDRLRSGWIDHGIRILAANPQLGVIYGMRNVSGLA
jgi:hypothetical protein